MNYDDIIKSIEKQEKMNERSMKNNDIKGSPIQEVDESGSDKSEGSVNQELPETEHKDLYAGILF